MKAKPDIDCRECDGRGYCEAHSDTDPDGATFTCEHCKGTGWEPWRPAGERYTGPRKLVNGFGLPDGDPLEALRITRAVLLDKSERSRRYLSAENARWDYEKMRRRATAYRAGLAQADMLARATMCATAMAQTIASMRSAA